MLIYSFFTLALVVSCSSLMAKEPNTKVDTWILYEEGNNDTSDTCKIDIKDGCNDNSSNDEEDKSESDCSFDKINEEEVVDVQLEEMLAGVELDSFILKEVTVNDDVDDADNVDGGNTSNSSNFEIHESFDEDCKEGESQQFSFFNIADSESSKALTPNQVETVYIVTQQPSKEESASNYVSSPPSCFLIQRINNRCGNASDSDNSSDETAVLTRKSHKKHLTEEYDSKYPANSSCLFYYFPLSRCTCAMFCCCMGGTCDPFLAIRNGGKTPPSFRKDIPKNTKV